MDSMTCALCECRPRRPILLRCLHSSCMECVQGNVTEGAVFCRLCDTKVEVKLTPSGVFMEDPVTGVCVEEMAIMEHADKPIACSSCSDQFAAVCRCVHCMDYLCQSCTEAHQRLKLTKNHRLVGMDELRRSRNLSDYLQSYALCEEHNERSIVCFCMACDQPVCQECLVSTHKDHARSDLAAAQNAAISKLRQLQFSVERCFNETVAVQIDIEEKLKSVDTQTQRTREQVDTFFSEAIASLERKRVAVLQELDESTRKDSNNLVQHHRMLNINIKGTQHFRQYIEQATRVLSLPQLLAIVRTIERRSSDFSQPVSLVAPDGHRPVETEFNQANLMDIINTIGLVHTDRCAANKTEFKQTGGARKIGESNALYQNQLQRSQSISRELWSTTYSLRSVPSASKVSDHVSQSGNYVEDWKLEQPTLYQQGGASAINHVRIADQDGIRELPIDNRSQQGTTPGRDLPNELLSRSLVGANSNREHQVPFMSRSLSGITANRDQQNEISRSVSGVNPTRDPALDLMSNSRAFSVICSSRDQPTELSSCRSTSIVQDFSDPVGKGRFTSTFNTNKDQLNDSIVNNWSFPTTHSNRDQLVDVMSNVRSVSYQNRDPIGRDHLGRDQLSRDQLGRDPIGRDQSTDGQMGPRPLPPMGTNRDPINDVQPSQRALPISYHTRDSSLDSHANTFNISNALSSRDDTSEALMNTRFVLSPGRESTDIHTTTNLASTTSTSRDPPNETSLNSRSLTAKTINRDQSADDFSTTRSLSMSESNKDQSIDPHTQSESSTVQLVSLTSSSQTQQHSIRDPNKVRVEMNSNWRASPLSFRDEHDKADNISTDSHYSTTQEYEKGLILASATQSNATRFTSVDGFQPTSRAVTLVKMSASDSSTPTPSAAASVSRKSNETSPSPLMECPPKSLLKKTSLTGNQVVYAFGHKGTGPGEFNGVYGVAHDPHNDRIVATDFQNHRVQVFDISGSFILQFGTKGYNDGQLQYPTGVCCDPQGEIYVCERLGNNVQLFDSKGRFVHKYVNSDMKASTLCFANGRVIVADPTNKCLHILDLSSGRWIVLPSSESQGVQYPGYVNSDSKGCLVVSDVYKQNILVYDQDLAMKKTVLFPKERSCGISRPAGICFTTNGGMAVADRNSNQILLFGQDGDFIGHFGRKGDSLGSFNDVHCLGSSPDGKIFAADFRNNRVVVVQNVCWEKR